MNDFQKARDVLAHVRAASTIRPWSTDTSWSGPGTGEAFESANVVVDMWDIATFSGGVPDEGREDRARADRALFMLTSDPELLDAIDALLDEGTGEPSAESSIVEALRQATVQRLAQSVAAAIIAADERMSS